VSASVAGLAGTSGDSEYVRAGRPNGLAAREAVEKARLAVRCVLPEAVERVSASTRRLIFTSSASSCIDVACGYAPPKGVSRPASADFDLARVISPGLGLTFLNSLFQGASNGCGNGTKTGCARQAAPHRGTQHGAFSTASKITRALRL
jgi:hypothetical protein